MTEQKSNPHSGKTEQETAAGRKGNSKEDEVEEYGGGSIKARHGRVNWWLLAVYVVLIVWAGYYGYKYWGGLGPGLAY